MTKKCAQIVDEKGHRVILSLWKKVFVVCVMNDFITTGI
jgi:hypothetical protein